MFYFPLTDKSSWGAHLPDSPVTLNPQLRDGPMPVTEFVIAVGKWSGWNGRTGYVEAKQDINQ